MVLQYPKHKKWRGDLSAAAGQTSAPFIVPGWVKNLTARLLPGGGGSALLQYTLDDEDDVDTDPNNRTWTDWDPGTVTAATVRSVAGAITAVRITATTQAATAQLTGDRMS